MDRSLPGDHAFEPVNGQQITEDDVRTFLQSFPEFKDCRFEVEIVQANNPNSLQSITAQYDDVVGGRGGFVDTTAEHLSILPPELRDQYVRVDCINLPYDNQGPPSSEAYTRVDPDGEYVPPTEADFKDSIWSFERSLQQPTSSSNQLLNSATTNVATPYYSIQQQLSDGASSKTSTPAVEDELPPVYRVPPAPSTVQSNVTVNKNSHSPVSNASSSAGSLVELQKPVESHSRDSPLVVKERFSGNVSSSDYQKEITRTPSKETPPATNQTMSSLHRYPRDNQAATIDDGAEKRINVSELSKRFAETKVNSPKSAGEQRQPNEVRRSRSSTVGGSPSLPERKKSTKQRQRTPIRRSRTAESASTPNKKRDNSESYFRPAMERRRHRHSGHDYLGHLSREVTRRDNRRKCMRRKHPASPTISFSKDQKYCYINGEKFKMVDYSDVVDQVGGYMQEKPYGMPVENGYYSTLPASLKPLDGAPFGEYAVPPPGLMNQMQMNGGLYAGGRSANYLCSTLPRRTNMHIPSRDVPMVSRAYPSGGRRHRNRVHSMHKDRPLYDRTHMMAATPGTRQWDKLVSFPKSGRPQFYNSPYTHFSMWA